MRGIKMTSHFGPSGFHLIFPLEKIVVIHMSRNANFPTFLTIDVSPHTHILEAHRRHVPDADRDPFYFFVNKSPFQFKRCGCQRI